MATLPPSRGPRQQRPPGLCCAPRDLGPAATTGLQPVPRPESRAAPQPKGTGDRDSSFMFAFLLARAARPLSRKALETITTGDVFLGRLIASRAAPQPKGTGDLRMPRGVSARHDVGAARPLSRKALETTTSGKASPRNPGAARPLSRKALETWMGVMGLVSFRREPRGPSAERHWRHSHCVYGLMVSPTSRAAPQPKGTGDEPVQLELCLGGDESRAAPQPKGTGDARCAA